MADRDEFEAAAKREAGLKAEAEHFRLCWDAESKENADLRREVERLQHENSQAKDAIAQLSEGKLLGELAGKQTIVNMAREIMRLKHDITVAGEMYEDAQDEIAELKMELDDLKGNSTYD